MPSVCLVRGHRFVIVEFRVFEDPESTYAFALAAPIEEREVDIDDRARAACDIYANHLRCVVEHFSVAI